MTETTPTQAKKSKSEKESSQHKIFARPYMIVLSVVFVAIIGVSLYAAHTRSEKQANDKKAAVNAKCPDDLLRQANSLLNGDSSALQAIVSNIQANSGYDQDANCLNVVTVYYVTVGDADNASASFAKLQKVYTPKQGFNTTIGTNLWNIDTLKSAVENAELAKQQAIANSKQFTSSKMMRQQQ